jgi:hypothetical protein
MKIVIVISIILLSTSSIAVLKFTVKKSLKFKIKSKARSIDEDFIQEIVNGITNGLVPRIVLAKLCEDYFLTQTKEAALSGNSIIKSLELDLSEDLLSKGFGSLWQVCENNGTALSPALNQFAQQIRTEKELRDERRSGDAWLRRWLTCDANCKKRNGRRESARGSS